MIRPIRDGKGLFHDEPDDLASVVEARGLRLIEPGRWGMPIGVLPYLEEEAIARLRQSIGPLGENEAEWKRESWDWWRSKWVQEAHYFMQTSMQGPLDATTAYSAAEVLIRASELRHAINDGKAEKAAALAMLVASWVFIGGVTVRLAAAEPLATSTRKAQRERAAKERTTVQADDGRVRKRDLVEEALAAAGNDAGTAAVWGHLVGVLARNGISAKESGAKDERELLAEGVTLKPNGKPKPVRFTFKGVQTMLTKLRKGEAPAKRGRPRKKPA